MNTLKPSQLRLIIGATEHPKNIGHDRGAAGPVETDSPRSEVT